MSSIAELSILTVPKLKERCRELGITVGGKKADLIARIQAKTSINTSAPLPTLNTTQSTTQPVPDTSFPASSIASGLVPLSLPTPAPTKKVAAPKKRKTLIQSTEKSVSSVVNPRKKAKTSSATASAVSPTVNDGERENVILANMTPLSLGQNIERQNDAVPASSAETVPPLGGISTKNMAMRAVCPTISLNPVPFESARDRAPDQTTTDQSKFKARPKPEMPPKLLAMRAVVGTKEQIAKKKGLNLKPLKAVTGADITPTALQTNIKSLGDKVTTATGVIGSGNTIRPSTKNDLRNVSGVEKSFEGRTKAPETRFKGLLPKKNEAPAIAYHGTNFGGFLETFDVTSTSDMPNGNGGLISDALDLGINQPIIGLKGPVHHPELSEPQIRNIERKKHKLNLPIVPRISVPQTTSLTPAPNYTLPAEKEDYEIRPRIIRNPPRISLRKKIEKIARVLGLVAFHGFSPAPQLAVPGDFLKLTSILSRNYRYASTLAFTHLVKLEFPGRRTEKWLKSKGVDEKVADLRSWYWFRVSCRTKVVERVRTWWAERMWRFLDLASASEGLMKGKCKEYGLYFNGINKNLFKEPDCQGQFEVVIRFWLQRFCAWTSGIEGGYEGLLEDLREDMIDKCHPVGSASDSREVWRVETKAGGLYFVVGLTGEVVGWVNETKREGNLGLTRWKRSRSKTKKNPRNDDTSFLGCPSRYGGGRPTKVHTTEDYSWKDLRDDWKQYVSSLISSEDATQEENSFKPLMNYIYHTGPETFPQGIHEAVTLPRHRALAERWVLTHVHAGGISGRQLIENKRKMRITLDLEPKFLVESVRCSGEKWKVGMKDVLAPGLGFVQTPEMGWFVLEETGQEIAHEDYLQGMWATLLGVDENGCVLSEKELDELWKFFVRKEDY